MGIGLDENKRPVEAFEPVGRSQNVTTSAVSAQSTTLNANTRFVRLCATAACYVEFGTNPTAAAGKILLPADVIEYFAVPVGASWKVAGIQVSAGGILNVVEFQ